MRDGPGGGGAGVRVEEQGRGGGDSLPEVGRVRRKSNVSRRIGGPIGTREERAPRWAAFALGGSGEGRGGGSALSEAGLPFAKGALGFARGDCRGWVPRAAPVSSALPEDLGSPSTTITR